MISVYGSTGFIGSKFCSLYKNDCIKIKRDSRAPQSDNILYFISTIDNYNIFDNPKLDINTNLNVLIDTLEECRKYSPNITFNFISSWFVYGKGHKSPCSETSYCNPTGFYSITKRAAEQMLISYCETYNIKYRILRLCNVIGLSDKKASKKKNALQFMINNLLNDEPISLYEGGKHKRDYMHVEDVCHAINKCIQKSSENEIINIGTGKSIDIFTLINFCKNKIGSKSEINNITTPEFHKVVQIENIHLNVDKLRKIGFNCNIDIFDRLEKMIEEENGK